MTASTRQISTVFPLWVFVAFAAALAMLAFGVAQVRPGLGVLVVALGSTLWTAYVVRRGTILRGRNG